MLSRELESIPEPRRAAIARFAGFVNGVAPVSSSLEGLGEDRLQTFSALVEAYDGQPNSAVQTKGRDLAGELSRRYQKSGDAYHRWIEMLLDAVEHAPSVGRFSALSLLDRRATLRSWFSSQEPADKLMTASRPGDEHEPDSIQASYERMLESMQGVVAKLPREALLLDARTGLPHYQPPVGSPVAITERDPMGTLTRVLRHLRWSAHGLLASFFNEDGVHNHQDEVDFK